MLFNSYIFIFLFLPIALIGYFGLNRIGKYTLAKYFLVGMSLWFYAYFNISYLWIILASIAINFLCHRMMLSENLQREHMLLRKSVFFAGLIFNIGLLFYFKYFNFFVDNVNNIFDLSIHVEKILLPLGISFFTFQQIAFLVDTGRGEVDKQFLCDYMLFVTFFPQLVAGPIVSHKEMLPQFRNAEIKSPDGRNLYMGLRIFVLGLSKKILLADIIGQSVGWGYEHISLLGGAGSMLLILFYTLQIYFDFSGYCDMARGLGCMFNFKLPYNFASPYKARNIIDFWNRWHMTLTRFFTQYLYIPMGGNRKGIMRTYINIFIVFLISGIWHGAGFTFILWGILHGLLNVFTRIYHKLIDKVSYPGKDSVFWGEVRVGISVLLTFICVNVLWVFFRADSISQAVALLTQVVDINNFVGVAELSSFFVTSELWYVFKILRLDGLSFINYIPMLLYIAVSLWLIWGCKNIAETEEKHTPTIMGCVLISCLFIWCIVSLSNVSTFLYFNF